MLTELRQQIFNWPWRGESIILLLCAPFLLFPTQFPLLTAVFLLLLSATWLYPFIRHKQPILPISPLNVILLIWSFAFLTSILVTADPLLTLPKTTSLLLGFAVWRYLLVHVQSQQETTVATWGFLFLGLGLTMVGILSTNWLFKIPFIAELLQRFALQFLILPESPALGTHTNQLAATIIIFWPLTLSLFLGKQWLRWPKLSWVGIGLTAVFATLILILTQSRSSWVGAFVSFGFMLLFWERLLNPSSLRRRLRLGLLAFATATVLAIFIIGPSTLQTWWLEPPDDTVVGSLVSLNLRQEIWPWAVQTIYDFPFTGVGLGTFRQVGPRLYPLNLPLDYDFGHAHNLFLQVALDFGVVGLVSYIALLLGAGVMAWQMARHDQEKRPLAIGLLAGLVALHVYGLADALAPGAKPGILLWYNIGLINTLFLLKTPN